MRIFLLILLSFSLLGCGDKKPKLSELTVIGTIDEDKIISTKEIHALGYEPFRKEYLGKVITITGLIDAKWTGGYSRENGQCTISYSTGYDMLTPGYDPSKNKHPVSATIFANFFPDEVILDSLAEALPEYVQYDGEVALPDTVCTKKCEWNPNDKNSCFYRSPHTILTGKVMSVGRKGRRIGMTMKLKGVAF